MTNREIAAKLIKKHKVLLDNLKRDNRIPGFMVTISNYAIIYNWKEYQS